MTTEITPSTDEDCFWSQDWTLMLKSNIFYIIQTSYMFLNSFLVVIFLIKYKTATPWNLHEVVQYSERFVLFLFCQVMVWWYGYAVLRRDHFHVLPPMESWIHERNPKPKRLSMMGMWMFLAFTHCCFTTGTKNLNVGILFVILYWNKWTLVATWKGRKFIVEIRLRFVKWSAMMFFKNIFSLSLFYTFMKDMVHAAPVCHLELNAVNSGQTYNPPCSAWQTMIQPKFYSSLFWQNQLVTPKVYLKSNLTHL